MVNPSHTGKFNFPSSTRSIGSRKSSSQGNRHHARHYNFYKRTKNSGMGADSCQLYYCATFDGGCIYCAV